MRPDARAGALAEARLPSEPARVVAISPAARLAGQSLGRRGTAYDPAPLLLIPADQRQNGDYKTGGAAAIFSTWDGAHR